jgi:hypothetical protein
MVNLCGLICFAGLDAQPVVDEEYCWAVLDKILVVAYSFAPVKLKEYPYGILYSLNGSESTAPMNFE